MRFKGLIVFVLGGLFGFRSQAQGVNDLAQSRVLILLDESSSMLNNWAGARPKYKVAEELILKLMDSIYTVNPNVEFSLRVFGSQSTVPENDCHDTRNEVPFEKGNRQRMELRLDDIKPLGVTSIAYSLKQAALNDLVDVAHNAYSIILVTDGGESCGGNICDVMRMLVRNKVFFRPYIVGLEDVPGLSKEYECMGDYLQVTKEGDMPKAIGLIVEAFRPALKMTKTEYKELQATPKIEEVKKVEPPKVTPPPPPPPPVEVKPEPRATASIDEVSTADLRVFDTYRPAQPKLASVTVPDVKLDIPEEAPPPPPEPVKPDPVNIARAIPAKLTTIVVTHPSPAQKLAIVGVPPMPEIAPEPAKPEPVNIVRLASARLNTLNIPAPKANKLKTATIPAMPVIEVEIEKPAPVEIAKLQTARMRQFNIMWVMDDRGIAVRAVPPMPTIRVDVPITKVETSGPTKTATGAPVPAGMKTMDFTVNVEEAKQTTVQVYFTDGKGKFYPTTPQVVLQDKAKKPIKKFYRTVDGAGEPDPVPDVPAGTYDLTFVNKPSYIVPGVTIIANKANKVIVRLPKPTLRFEYAEPNTNRSSARPVSEFVAVVIERNKLEGGRVQDQKCTEALEYEPGNYHVKINTYPQDIRNIDLDFDEYVITIKQPGFAKLTAADPGINTVSLYQRVGDRYLKFVDVNLADPRYKRLNLQPAEYQVHYQKGPGGTVLEKVKPFVVRATELVEVTLE